MCGTYVRILNLLRRKEEQEVCRNVNEESGYGVMLLFCGLGSQQEEQYWISPVDVCRGIETSHTGTDVWLCTSCHVADSCCGTAHTT